MFDWDSDILCSNCDHSRRVSIDELIKFPVKMNQTLDHLERLLCCFDRDGRGAQISITINKSAKLQTSRTTL